MTVLVTGGTGYIGSHVVRLLQAAGEQVVIVDDLVNGVPERVPGVEIHQADLADLASIELIARLCREHGVDQVIHFAARKIAPESVARPAWYYQQNVGGLANLLIALEDAGVHDLVFSSSAAVYGLGQEEPIAEDAECVPINPYGESKLAGEWLVRAAIATGKFRATSLRYFNVAGCGAPELADGVALNLIPMVIERVLRDERPMVFGADYDTADGTCIRDFVHVQDLAAAHVLALQKLREGAEVAAEYNVGTGTGYSVLEVIDEVGRAAGRKLEPEICPRRPGDPIASRADASRIERDLGWRAEHTLQDMVQSAWDGWLATH